MEPRNRGCGLGTWRPAYLRRFANMPSFTAVLSLVIVFGNMNYSYYSAVIGQIEKQFGLSSQTTGFIKNVDNIGYMGGVLLFAHFCRNSNKPRLFAGATVAISLSVAFYATPYFVYDFDNDISQVNYAAQNGTSARSNTTFETRYDLCDPARGNPCDVATTRDNFRSSLGVVNRGALAIFVLSELLQGIAQSSKYSLSLTFIDDNTKQNTAKYFGVIYATRSGGTFLGFALGAWTSSLYVDLTDPGIDQRNSRWIGAWWLGYLICGLATIIWAVPIAMFPDGNLDKSSGQDNDIGNSDEEMNNMIHNNNNTIEESRDEVVIHDESPVAITRDESSLDPIDDFKELFASLKRVLSNPVYVLVVLGLAAHLYIIGFYTFLPKYNETQFEFSPSQTSAIVGLVMTFCSISGQIVGAKMMCSKDMTPMKAMKIIFMIQMAASIFYCLCVLIGSEENKTSWDLSSGSRNSTCFTDCACEHTPYMPVCDPINSVTYFSPCDAGCHRSGATPLETAFTDCSCTSDGTAVLGVCRESKWMKWLLYMVCLCLGSILSGSTAVPITMTILKCVEKRDKAIAMALLGCLIMIISFPGPAIFGRLVDGSCVVHQMDMCTRDTGACLKYDKFWFRISLHGTAAAIEVLASLIYMAALVVATKSSPRHNYVKRMHELFSKQEVDENQKHEL